MHFDRSILLAPLTKGGNLPFRRHCLAGGATTTMSEMAYARQVVRKTRSEMALLRHHPDEASFGVQIAANKTEQAAEATKIAAESGAHFVDLNCGCPIHDVVRRGMGASLLKRPAALGRVVEAMVAAVDVPITVKIRSGWSEDKSNASEVARIVEESGAVALTIHPRSREQRYSKAADWSLVGQLVSERAIPILGSGDVLTWYEAEDRFESTGCAGLMLGRGALIKPWLFREIAEGRSIEPDAGERLGMLMQFVGFLKEHFRDDELGRKRAMRFLPWHLGFFCRYRPLPASEFRDASREHPLMQTRNPLVVDESRDDAWLAHLLGDPRDEMHEAIAERLWDGADREQIEVELAALAAAMPPVAGEPEPVKNSHG